MEAIKDVIGKYQALLLTKVGSDQLGQSKGYGPPGVPNREFLSSLKHLKDIDPAIIIHFIKECRLLVEKQVCKCGKDMTWAECTGVKDGFIWRCNRRTNGKKCNCSKSIRADSWFSRSKLSCQAILQLTYCLIHNVSAKDLIREYSLSSHTLADWRNYVRERLVDYVELHSEQLGGPGKIVEIDESKIGRRKYHKGHRVEGQWVFGGYERGSGKVFFVAVEDRTSETLIKIIKEWIRPESTIISDCWKAYDALGKENYTHLTVNHSLHFKDPDTGAHTNGIESSWRHLKVSVPEYMRRKHSFKGYLAEHMFKKSCAYGKEDRFLRFLKIIQEDVKLGKEREESST